MFNAFAIRPTRDSVRVHSDEARSSRARVVNDLVCFAKSRLWLLRAAPFIAMMHELDRVLDVRMWLSVFCSCDDDRGTGGGFPEAVGESQRMPRSNLRDFEIFGLVELFKGGNLGRANFGSGRRYGRGRVD